MFWRRDLPHWVPEDSIVFVTWRLAGSPARTDSRERSKAAKPRTFGDRLDEIDEKLDRLPGERWLQDPRVAKLMADALRYGESGKSAYELIAWVIMPNHVHVLFRPMIRLDKIVRWLKVATASRANRILRRIGNEFWDREYFDHWVRSDEELTDIMEYIERNPVCAGLVKEPGDWPWSSLGNAGGKTTGSTISRR